MKKSLLIVPLLFLAFFSVAHAQTASSMPSTVTEKAQVVAVISQGSEQIAGTAVTSPTQSIKIKIISGPDTGNAAVVENDSFVSKVGDIVYVKHTVDVANGVDSYAVTDPYRLPVLGFFIGLFVVCAIAFGGRQGFRGLIALGLGFLAIAYILLPGILHGFSPIAMSMLVASLIVIVGSYVTHGWNRVTTTAVIGMIVTILLTSGLAWAAIHFGRLTGLATEEAVYLNFDTGGRIDFASLLAGGILIGLLGILYDAAIGQAAAVDELRQAAPHLPRRAIFNRALRIGREHIGALTNSLALAYVGVSLPLLLLFYSSSSGSFLSTANSELFATEIIRAMIGSIGLILTVPLTTAAAVLLLIKNDRIRE